eukprot:scaffold40166_cov155-Skeletonema_dohrnii-CCMP3373.AAC.1
MKAESSKLDVMIHNHGQHVDNEDNNSMQVQGGQSITIRPPAALAVLPSDSSAISALGLGDLHLQARRGGQ